MASDRYLKKFYKDCLKRVLSKISGIADDDLTTAEKDIKRLVTEALKARFKEGTK